MMYRVGRPGWRLFARWGGAVVYRVRVVHDREAGVFIASSPDIRGLVAEAETFDELFNEVRAGADELLSEQVQGSNRPRALGVWPNSDEPVPA